MFARVLALTYLQASATKPRRVVFSILVLWAVLGGFLSFRDWRHNNNAPFWLSFAGFLGSVFLSLWFIALVAMIWDWLARRWHQRTAARGITDAGGAAAHREVVRLLCAGKLKLKRIRRDYDFGE